MTTSPTLLLIVFIIGALAVLAFAVLLVVALFNR
jgi:hypothetical protein